MLKVSGIEKSYSKAHSTLKALDAVPLYVADGGRTGLNGASGSGKSTLARIIIGLERADAGSLEFAGVALDPCGKANKRTREQKLALGQMQMIFQHPASSFANHMQIGQAIIEGIAYRPDFDKNRAHAQMHEALEMVGLPASYEHKHITEVSGGECQRVAIARAIISRPKLLICDEPTSALDVTVQASIINLLATLRQELSLSCVFISHDLALVRGFCERVYVIDHGKIAEEGMTKEVFENPQSAITQRLLKAALMR